MSRNIEINIKTQDESTQQTQYEVLYPKNTSKNVVFNPDNGDNVTVYDKLNNITPNNSFELGDILLTSKINIDIEKWKLCDGSELDNSIYAELGNITNLNSFTRSNNVQDIYAPTNLSLYHLFECNGYYFRQTNYLNVDSINIYKIKIGEDLTVLNNWQQLSQSFDGRSDTSYNRQLNLEKIYYLENHYILYFKEYYRASSSNNGYYAFIHIYDNNFVFKKKYKFSK